MAEIKEAIKAIEAGNYIMFRDKPFIREKNAICYGRMDDKYILFMLILSEKDGEVLFVDAGFACMRQETVAALSTLARHFGSRQRTAMLPEWMA